MRHLSSPVAHLPSWERAAAVIGGLVIVLIYWQPAGIEAASNALLKSEWGKVIFTALVIGLMLCVLMFLNAALLMLWDGYGWLRRTARRMKPS
jgi:hypothetical protein